MNIPTKKLVNGFEIPVFGIGTWLMGGNMVHDTNNDDEADINGLKSALGMGITYIDTADIYAQGYAEILVGKAIQGYDRAKLFITSKVFKTHLRYDETLKAMQESLKRIHTEYLDLYLIHAPNPEIPLKETMKAMTHLKDVGFTKSIGVSNFSIGELKEAQSYTPHKIVTNQIHYNLAHKGNYKEQSLSELVTYCQDTDILITAYRPIERGILTITDQPLIKEMTSKYNKTSAQIAINWLISQKNVVTLSKMRNADHLKENLKALDWSMKDEDVEKLRLNFPDLVTT